MIKVFLGLIACYLILFVLLIITSGCATKVKEPLYRMGDVVRVEKGYYTNSVFTIQLQILDIHMEPCKEHQYFGYIQRNGVFIEDFICHEDLGVRL